MKDFKLYINKYGFTSCLVREIGDDFTHTNPFFYMRLNNISKYQFNDRILISRITNC